MIRELRVVPSTDEILLVRCRYLMDVLAEAQSEMAVALDAGDVAAVCASGRRLMSVGWLFKESADKHELACRV